jgi:hypothetical protein
MTEIEREQHNQDQTSNSEYKKPSPPSRQIVQAFGDRAREEGRHAASEATTASESVREFNPFDGEYDA